MFVHLYNKRRFRFNHLFKGGTHEQEEIISRLEGLSIKETEEEGRKDETFPPEFS